MLLSRLTGISTTSMLISLLLLLLPTIASATLAIQDPLIPYITSDETIPLDKQLYGQAMSILSKYPQFATSKTLNSDSQIVIELPMDYSLDYIIEDNLLLWERTQQDKKHALELLEEASELRNVDATFLLAEINMYGNYTLPTNATLALKYYEKVVSLQANSTAYFNIGFIYSTGLFGHLEPDQSKAILYYEFAYQTDGDLRAAMVLAYRYCQGIGVDVDFEKAVFYYQYVANKLHAVYEKESPIGGMHLDSFSLRVADFHGGVYGDGVGETRSSLDRKAARYDFLQERSGYGLLTELGENGSDDGTLFNELYAHVLNYYEGSYLQSRDYVKAYKYAKHAMDQGLSQLEYLGDLDRRYVAKCIYILAKMYLRGEGVHENHIKARELFNASLDVFPFSDTYNDLGLLYEYTEVEELKNITLARQFYHNSSISKSPSPSGNYNYGRMLMNSPSKTHQRQGVELISNATDHLELSAVYHHSQLLITNPWLSKSQDITLLQLRDLKFYVESFDPIVTSLEWSLYELIFGRSENALIGYAMAAEQGYESAQASVAYILYRLPSVLEEPPIVPESRQLAAITYLTRSSYQFNLDSTVYLGDLYHQLGQYDKATAAYEAASGRGSSQGSFNLGWCYEQGIGVEKDFHLAKRFYDLALLGKGEPKRGMGAYLPVKLSLLRLRVKSFIGNLIGVDCGLNDDEDKQGMKRRTWADWSKAYGKIRGGNYPDENKPTASTTSNGDNSQVTSFWSEVAELFTPSMEDLALIMFVVVSFGLFFVVNWNQQRRLRERREAGEDVGDGPRFEFNFQVVAI